MHIYTSNYKMGGLGASPQKTPLRKVYSHFEVLVHIYKCTFTCIAKTKKLKNSKRMDCFAAITVKLENAGRFVGRPPHYYPAVMVDD
jgi:hypothetical protein